MDKKEQPVGVILLAGGMGTRMRSATPKQYLTLKDKPLILYPFDKFCEMSEIVEIVVVCQSQYRPLFDCKRKSLTLSFAYPGERRQDSVLNGLQALTPHCSLICVHDGVRPFISTSMIRNAIEAAVVHGAATLGIPAKATMKQCSKDLFVTKTLDRSTLWEIQTPQVIQRDWLHKGLLKAQSENLTVTDDVSAVELLGHSVKIVHGSESNLKITTPEDLEIAKVLATLESDRAKDV